MSESDLAIVAALVVARGALSARLERFDVTAPIVFVLAGLALTHGPLAALESLGHRAETAVTVISITVLLSVIAHGVSAEPLAHRCAAVLARTAGGPAQAGQPEVPTRRLIRHRSGGPGRPGP